MSLNFEEKLDRYINILIHVGVNLQPGQRLLLRAPLEAAEVVRQTVRSAYQANARYVQVDWIDQQLKRLRLEHSAEEYLTDYPAWRPRMVVDYIDSGAAMLVIVGDDPELLDGIDPKRKGIVRAVETEQNKPVGDRISADASPWLVVSAPTPAWAAKVFPGVPVETAIARLWEAIFEVCRINSPDPVAAWQAHVDQLQQRADLLNERRYTELRYRAPGTDLRIGLPDLHVWQGGAAKSKTGITFIPNIPTEEVFTMPHRERVDGVVTSTKPLNLNGTLVEEMVVRFEGGQVVSATARRGEVELNQLLTIDEGARRLGELALVPHSSPISQSGILFYETLYDENASCHLAFGEGYRVNLFNGQGMTDEEFRAAGANESQTHEDFMIGSGHLDIDGVRADGSVEAVMRGGEWVGG